MPTRQDLINEENRKKAQAEEAGKKVVTAEQPKEEPTDGIPQQPEQPKGEAQEATPEATIPEEANTQTVSADSEPQKTIEDVGGAEAAR